MVPASFDSADKVLGPPPTKTEEEVHSLLVKEVYYANDDLVTWSCWKLTLEELEEFQRTGRIWLGVFGRMPPVLLTGNKPTELNS